MYTKTPVYVKKYPSSELLAPTIILRHHMFLYSENRQRPNTNRSVLHLPAAFLKTDGSKNELKLHNVSVLYKEKGK